MTDTILLASGVMLLVGGLILRVTQHRRPATDGDVARIAASEGLVGLGLGVMTSAPVVIGLAGLLCFARWNGATARTARCSVAPSSWRNDSLYAAGVIAAAVVIQSLKGLVPLQ